MTAAQVEPIDGVEVLSNGDDETPADELELLRTGRIRVRLNDDEGAPPATLILRRPKLGEYRHLRELYDDLAARDAEEQEAVKAAKERGERARFDSTRSTAEWMLTVLDKLAGDHGLTLDTAPTWFSSPALIPMLLAHWRSVPLARSSLAGQTRPPAT